MSAVTLQEIGEFVASRLRVSVSLMQSGVKRGRFADDEQTRLRDARNIVLVLACRHTQASRASIVAYLGIKPGGGMWDRIADVIEFEADWRAADRAVNAAIEDIEQQIDALHERRMAERDRNIVRV